MRIGDRLFMRETLTGTMRAARDPVVLQGHSRHECVNTRGHCTRDENIFMTRMV